MKWLRVILQNATVINGVLDVDGLMNIICKEFPKNAVPKSVFNHTNHQLKETIHTIAHHKKDMKDCETLKGIMKRQEATIEKLREEVINCTRMQVLRDKLKVLDVVDADYLIYKYGGLKNFNFDKKGTPIGVESIVNSYKLTMAHLFKKEEKIQDNNRMVVEITKEVVNGIKEDLILLAPKLLEERLNRRLGEFI